MTSYDKAKKSIEKLLEIITRGNLSYFPVQLLLITIGGFIILASNFNEIEKIELFIMYCTGVIFLEYWIVQRIQNNIVGILNNTLSLNRELSTDNNLLYEIDVIATKTQNIYTLLGKVEFYRKLNPNIMHIYITKSRSIGMGGTFNKFYKAECEFIYHILTDLRSDLLTRIEDQKQTLTGAKADVEEHISGTTALEQVSEAQKLRLDEQIRQFEEFQRVLVRV